MIERDRTSISKAHPPEAIVELWDSRSPTDYAGETPEVSFELRAPDLRDELERGYDHARLKPELCDVIRPRQPQGLRANAPVQPGVNPGP